MSRAPVRNGAEVTAVFPCEPGSVGRNDRTCYAHGGQDSACSFGWYRSTRPATPAEYADLARELEPIGYRLKIVRGMTPVMDRIRREPVG